MSTLDYYILDTDSLSRFNAREISIKALLEAILDHINIASKYKGEFKVTVNVTSVPDDVVNRLETYLYNLNYITTVRQGTKWFGLVKTHKRFLEVEW